MCFLFDRVDGVGCYYRCPSRVSLQEGTVRRAGDQVFNYVKPRCLTSRRSVFQSSARIRQVDQICWIVFASTLCIVLCRHVETVPVLAERTTASVHRPAPQHESPRRLARLRSEPHGQAHCSLANPVFPRSRRCGRSRSPGRPVDSSTSEHRELSYRALRRVCLAERSHFTWSQRRLGCFSGAGRSRNALGYTFPVWRYGAMTRRRGLNAVHGRSQAWVPSIHINICIAHLRFHRGVASGEL